MKLIKLKISEQYNRERDAYINGEFIKSVVSSDDTQLGKSLVSMLNGERRLALNHSLDGVLEIFPHLVPVKFYSGMTGVAEGDGLMNPLTIKSIAPLDSGIFSVSFADGSEETIKSLPSELLG